MIWVIQMKNWQITTDSATTGSESEDNKALAELNVNKLREKRLLK